jgi:GT2 family glycosyltransferase
MPAAPEVSVVLATHNRPDRLAALLESLRAQTIGADAFEVVVVDDASTDERIRALPGAGRVRVVSLDGAPGAPFSPHLARFAALEATAAPYVACTDVDCRPDPRWLEAGLAALGRSPIVAGRATLSFRRHPTLWSLLDLDTFVDDAHATADGVASTTNLFLDRAVLEQFGGLDARESGGYDLTRRAARAGVQIAYAPDVVVSHAPHYDLGPLLRKVWRVNANAGNTEQPARAPRFGIGLDRALLTDHGLKPSPATRLAALPFVHAVIPAVAAVARLRGAMSRTARRSSRGD